MSESEKAYRNSVQAVQVDSVIELSDFCDRLEAKLLGRGESPREIADHFRTLANYIQKLAQIVEKGVE